MPLSPRRFILSALFLALASPISSVYAKFDPTKEFQEPPAVAERFTEPKGVQFDTPAFKKGKVDFTSQKEMENFIERLAQSSPHLRVKTLGRSQQGRAIPMLVFSAERAASAQTLMKNGKPTVLIVALQHGNEPAAGEAALAYAKSLAENKEGDVLSRINVLIVPRANPDGAEHFTRDLANGVNLNRDHLLLASPESRAINQLMTQYQPDVVLDAHEFSVAGRWVKKFDAVQGYDALVQYATTTNLPASLSEAMKSTYNETIFAAFKENSLNAFVYYTTNQINLEDKTLSMGGVGADAMRNVAGLRNSVSFLLETRGVGIGKAHFERRVWTQFVAMRAMVNAAAKQPEQLLALGRAVRNEVIEASGKGELTVKGKAAKGTQEVTLLDAKTGEPKTFDADWRSSLTIEPVLTRPRPYGYLLPVSQKAAAKKLRELGIEVYVVKSEQRAPVERYDIVERKANRKTDVTGKIGKTGNEMVQVTAKLSGEVLTDIAGYYYVPMNQPLANLAVAALEPETQSSFVANGIITLPKEGTKGADIVPLYRLTQDAPMVVELF
ncbi:hypothetical protein SOASR030_29170 [Leminorella grimontii]|uniref:Peptidase M14 domain-containing protein n=1 Tax=Leminorella grimontii TaxID=82981 RepID=A0AAV5N3X4_9GAMM|nr:M14 family metallocarboxypeptidase [Leminorella grimontii]KFC92920.1 zinc carboxypeptidase [Leminorella grimontii ATCC 33999 = DSM 5078]GKX56805.1 hypothetical protein SOASR030_29170 [Leminorella grimontii]VFS62335.1 Zinc carboxypeptidase [Leminorella grimontii]